MTMHDTKLTTAVGVFTDHEQARQAVDELRRMGVTEDRIGVAGRDDTSATRSTPGEGEDTHAGTGAAAGAATGAGIGVLWGIGVIAGMLPAIGPVIAGGALAAVLASAATGAAAAGLAGALIGLGIPKEEAEYYENEFNEGRILVTVDAGTRYDEAVEVLQSYGAYEYSGHAETRRPDATGL